MRRTSLNGTEDCLQTHSSFSPCGNARTLSTPRCLPSPRRQQIDQLLQRSQQNWLRRAADQAAGLDPRKSSAQEPIPYSLLMCSTET